MIVNISYGSLCWRVKSTKGQPDMAIEGIITFFLGYGTSTILDMLKARVSGEAKRSRVMEINVREIKGDVSEILDSLRYQMYEDYQVALRALQDASLQKEGSRGQKSFLRDATRAFSRCASRRYATGLPKAQALINKAICHQLLNEKRNTIQALKEARTEAQETAARDPNDVYVRVERTGPIDFAGPRGEILHGWYVAVEDVPALKNGALALIENIDQVLFSPNFV
jgi:hypothetical protein